MFDQCQTVIVLRSVPDLVQHFSTESYIKAPDYIDMDTCFTARLCGLRPSIQQEISERASEQQRPRPQSIVPESNCKKNKSMLKVKPQPRLGDTGVTSVCSHVERETNQHNQRRTDGAVLLDFQASKFPPRQG